MYNKVFARVWQVPCEASSNKGCLKIKCWGLGKLEKYPVNSVLGRRDSWRMWQRLWRIFCKGLATELHCWECWDEQVRLRNALFYTFLTFGLALQQHGQWPTSVNVSARNTCFTVVETIQQSFHGLQGMTITWTPGPFPLDSFPASGAPADAGFSMSIGQGDLLLLDGTSRGASCRSR